MVMFRPFLAQQVLAIVGLACFIGYTQARNAIGAGSMSDSTWWQIAKDPSNKEKKAKDPSAGSGEECQKQEVPCKGGICPNCSGSCYRAVDQNDTSRGPCDFMCVLPTQCNLSFAARVQSTYANATRYDSYPDAERRLCRLCKLTACKECSDDEKTCSHCHWGFRLDEELKCELIGWDEALPVVITVAILIWVPLFCWYVSLRRAPVVNAEVLHKAMFHRQHAKLRDHTSNGHEWYPFFASLRKTYKDGLAIGGASVLLHFNFQFAALCWTTFAIGGWLLAGYAAHEKTGHWRLFHSSTAQVNDIYSICSTIHEMDFRRKHVDKARFIYTVTLYLITVFGVILLAVKQRKAFCRIDAKSASMKDYALGVEGLPEESGPRMEQELVEFIEQTCEVKPVGVSVFWNFHEQVDEVDFYVKREVVACETRLSRNSITPQDLARVYPGFGLMPEMTETGQRCMQCLTSGYLSVLTSSDNERVLMDEHDRIQKTVDFVSSVKSTGTAYYVFTSEEIRDKVASQLSSPDAPLFRGCHPVHVHAETIEPEALVFSNYGFCKITRIRRFFTSIMVIILSIAGWLVCIFGPYAVYICLVFNATGEPSSAASEAVFTILVMLGNQLMYVVCDKAATWMRFENKNLEQTAYITFYMGAILVNFSVDMCVLYYTMRLTLKNLGISQMKELGVQSSLQLLMSDRLYMYNVPSCFIAPFMAEAFFTVVMPYHLGKLIVGSSDITQKHADEVLAPCPYALSRYADIILNLIQAVMSLFLDPGYVLYNLGFLFAGQIFIYLWDQHRVVRQAEGFHFSSELTERVAQWLMILPCAALASCVAFQLASLLDEGGPYHRWFDKNIDSLPDSTSSSLSSDLDVVTVAIVAYVVHCIFHVIALMYIVPACGNRDTAQLVQKVYKDAALEFPANYFNVNPVHCLRSKYTHQDLPPCMAYIRGKEHLQEINPAIGLYYRAQRWNNEDRTWGMELSAVFSPKSKKKKNEIEPITAERLWKLNSGDQSVEEMTKVGRWRRRLFFLRWHGQGTLDMVYVSDKGGAPEVACVLMQGGTTCCQLKELPEIALKRLPPEESETETVRMHQYERAISGHTAGLNLATLFDDAVHLPTLLYPFEVQCTDDDGQTSFMVIACPDEHSRTDWIGQIRSYFAYSAGCPLPPQFWRKTTRGSTMAGMVKLDD